MKSERRKRLLWLSSALWMALIFCMSAMPGDVSGEQSGRLARLLAAMMTPFADVQGTALETLETVVRKGAHMAEYAVLFVLYRASLCSSGVRRPGILALGMTVGYAATDELHQSFVPGRGPSAADVAIDGCGALLAWAMLGLGKRIRAGITVGK